LKSPCCSQAKEEREKAEKARTLTAHIPTVPNLSSVNIPAPRLGFQKTATIAPEPTVTEPKTSSLGSSSSEPSLKNESAQRSPAEGKQMHKSVKLAQDRTDAPAEHHSRMRSLPPNAEPRWLRALQSSCLVQ
jgi:hypothetical protein